MKPHSTETSIIGKWIEDKNGNLVEDANCLRIAWLLGHHFTKIQSHNGDWMALYLDPEDGRFWELDFPLGELHGGGPPRLTVVPPEDVLSHYRVGELR
jgi:hypothetical protein